MKGLKLILKSAGIAATTFRVGKVTIGQDKLYIAGPCAVETERQIIETALAVKKAGANLLRGGAFKPRTSPYSFQGLGIQGLKILQKAGQESGMPIITEVTDPRDVSWVAEYADILQIGARNMQNFSLLQEVGKIDKPVLLKRGMSATMEEWLNCGEYILSGGNPNVILCERGIRTSETFTRNTLDLSIVPALKQLTHLPVITDPSHGTGIKALIGPMCRASLAAGADGFMVEVHYNPCEALCDKQQALSPKDFSQIMAEVSAIEAVMKELSIIDHSNIVSGVSA